MEEGYSGVGINHRDNVVELYVMPDTIIIPELASYIEEGLVKVIEEEGTAVFTSE